MSRKMLQRPLSIFVLASFCASSGQAWALPTYNSQRNSALTAAQAYAIQNNPSLKGTSLFQDHLNPNVLYVSPSSKKTQSGVYGPINGAVNCPVFENQFALTYRLPPTAEFETKAAQGAYSPYFDLQYGNYYRFGNLISTLATKIASAELLKEKPEYAAYSIAQERLKLKNDQIDEIKTSLAALDQAVSTAATLLSIANPDQVAAAKEVLQQAVADRQARSPALIAQKANLEAEKIPLQDAYFTAKQAWQSYDLDLTRLSESITQAENAMNVVDKVALEVFGRNEKTLQAFETKVVGLASASYSIWGEEASGMQSALATSSMFGGKSYSVRQLPIFDVVLSSTVASNPHTAGNAGSGGSAATAPKTVLFKTLGSSLFKVLPGTSRLANEWQFRGKDGLPLRPVEVAPSASSGTFTSEINQGVYCMGSSNRGQPVRASTFLPIGGIRQAYFVDSYAYHPRPNRVMAQSVALNYAYHVKSDPMRVSCRLDVQKTMDYTRNSGEWNFLWWGEKWDDTRRTGSSYNGVNCSTDENPTGSAPNPGDSTARLDALRSKAINEISAEFLLNYAKSWRTEIVSAPQNIPDQSKFFSGIGTGLESICGPNVYCKVTSVVLKSLDEIAGSRSGSTSHQENFTGVITRNYNEQSFRTVKGDAVVDVTVDAP